MRVRERVRERDEERSSNVPTKCRPHFYLQAELTHLDVLEDFEAGFQFPLTEAEVGTRLTLRIQAIQIG